MKKYLLFILVGAATFAQSATHSATLNWTDTQNPSGTTYSVYRATGLCSGSPSFSKLATAITVKTYLDSTVVPGNYCYYVTATSNGVESSASNQAGAPVPSFAPTSLTTTIAKLEVKVPEYAN